MNNSSLHKVAHILLIVGGLNWLLHAFGWNAVEMLLGAWPMLVTIVYVLVGLSAVYALVHHMGKGSSASGNVM